MLQQIQVVQKAIINDNTTTSDQTAKEELESTVRIEKRFPCSHTGEYWALKSKLRKGVALESAGFREMTPGEQTQLTAFQEEFQHLDRTPQDSQYYTISLRAYD